MKYSRFVLYVSLAVGAVLGAAGCDPGGPGAEGTISLGSGVDSAGFATLEIRMFPDPGVEFDPAEGLPIGDEYYVSKQSLADITFPYDYNIGAGVGTTEEPRWIVIAWLATAELGDKPASGEIYGSAAFKVKKCGAYFGGYCDTTRGVDFAIETELP